MRAARAFCCEMAEKAWDELDGAEAVGLETTFMLRLSACHAARACEKAIRTRLRISGTAVVQETNRMQRILRHRFVVTQHAALNGATMENAGAAPAGLPAPAVCPRARWTSPCGSATG